MSTVPSVSIDEVSAALSEALQGVSAVGSAWVSSQHDAYDVWLLVEPVDMAAERELYALVDPLYARFPKTPFSLHVLNPRMFDDLDPETVVPARAQPVGLHAPA